MFIKIAQEPGLMDEQEYWMEHAGISADGVKNLERNHGDYFSTRQAAMELDITPNAVDALRMRGTLLGYRLRRPGTLNLTGHGLWWFFLKEDVWALKEDSRYAARSARAKAAAASVRRF